MLQSGMKSEMLGGGLISYPMKVEILSCPIDVGLYLSFNEKSWEDFGFML